MARSGCSFSATADRTLLTKARFIIFASRYDRMRRRLFQILQANPNLGLQRAVELLGESDVPAMDEMKGRFAQLLPPNIPDAAMRDFAKAMLKVKGLGRAMPRATPRPPRTRR